MIETIRHKGLKLYYENGNGSKLPADQLAKIARFLTALDAYLPKKTLKNLALAYTSSPEI